MDNILICIFQFLSFDLLVDENRLDMQNSQSMRINAKRAVPTVLYSYYEL